MAEKNNKKLINLIFYSFLLALLIKKKKQDKSDFHLLIKT